jgi:hypothetical protein
MATVLSVLIKAVNYGDLMPYALLLPQLVMLWNPLAVTVRIKMGKLNASMAHLVSWSGLFSILLAFPQHTGVLHLFMLSTLRIASGTLRFSVLLLNPGMVPHLIYPTYVFLAPLSQHVFLVLALLSWIGIPMMAFFLGTLVLIKMFYILTFIPVVSRLVAASLLMKPTLPLPNALLGLNFSLTLVSTNLLSWSPILSQCPQPLLLLPLNHPFLCVHL